MTKGRLLRIGRRLAKEKGLINLSLVGLCKEADIPEGSFRNIAEVTFEEYLDELRPLVNRKKLFPVVKGRVHKNIRRDYILEAAICEAEITGYKIMTLGDVARAASVSRSTVSFHFQNLESLRMEVMRVAIKDENLKIIAQGLINNDVCALRAPLKLKKRAAIAVGHLN